MVPETGQEFSRVALDQAPSRLDIVHAPFGTDHPYETRFEERRPRDPSGGDMVSIGFLTTPGGAAASVRLDWERNGRPQAPIFARAVANGTDDDRWLSELGVVEGGDEVTYRITATDAASATATSPEYRFVAHTWHRLAGAIVTEHTDERLTFMTVDAAGSEGPSIRVTPGIAPDSIRLLVGPADTTVSPVAMEPSVACRNGVSTFTLDRTTGRIGLRIGLRIGGQIGSQTGGPRRLRWLAGENGKILRVELTGELGDDERLVGFGERFDALDQRGRAPGVAVYEQYKNQGDRTYLPVPFFLSDAGYGLLVEGTTRVDFDLGRTIDDRWRCTAGVPSSSSELAITLFAGTPAAIVRGLTALTGRPEVPPTWVFGPWMSSNEWNTQARVLAEVEQTQAHGIPAIVLVIEAWSDETTFYVWNGSRYAPGSGDGAMSLGDFAFPADGPWPDPKGMTDALHAAGIRLVLWQIPVLKALDAPHAQHDADIAHAVANGYVVMDAAGSPYRNPAFWFRDALIPDLTDAAVADWWLAKRRYLLDEVGIDGFKTDGGEHLTGRDIVARDGRRGDELVNAFPNAYVGAYHRFTQDRRRGDGVTFSRAGHTGAGAFPAHWAGDENSTWEAFQRSIVAGLTAGLSGVPFWGWDIAGFSDALPSAELYLRSTAMAAFCPIMQYHSEYNPDGPSRDRTPWNIARHTGDDRVIPLARHFARLRMNLLPYILNEAAHAAATGEPMLRALLLDDPDDAEVWSIADQYRFGRDLLVAPVAAEGTTERRLYLPAGDWYELWDGTRHAGGRWLTVAAPLDRIPVFVRAGAVIPLHLSPGGALGDDVGNALTPERGVSWRVFPGNTEPRTADFSPAFGTGVTVEVSTEAGGVRVAVSGSPGPAEVVLPKGRTMSLNAASPQAVVFFGR